MLEMWKILILKNKAINFLFVGKMVVYDTKRRMEMKEHRSMPEEPQSYWLETTDMQPFKELHQDTHVHTVIVGAGITGITLAYLLVRQGVKVALIDAGKIAAGTTGHTTAKITAQHDLIYDKLIQNSGEENARLYYDANTEAMQFIAKTVNEHKIECDFSEQDAYIFTNSDDQMANMSAEINAYEILRINGTYKLDIPLNIETKAAIVQIRIMFTFREKA